MLVPIRTPIIYVGNVDNDYDITVMITIIIEIIIMNDDGINIIIIDFLIDL